MISITEQPIAVMVVFSDSVQYETLHYISLEQYENVVNLVIQDKQILFIKKKSIFCSDYSQGQNLQSGGFKGR